MISFTTSHLGEAPCSTPNDQPGSHSYDISPDCRWAFHTYLRSGHVPVVDLVSLPDAKRVRKLLLHRQEIDKLYGETQVKGRALVVLKLYWKNGRVKAELGVGHGKLAHDKRQDLKKRAVDRETAREVARFHRKQG